MMVRGNDSNFRELAIQAQGLHHLPSAWPYSYACPDFRKLVRRFIYIDANVGVLREGYCAGKTTYPASTKINK